MQGIVVDGLNLGIRFFFFSTARLKLRKKQSNTCFFNSIKEKIKFWMCFQIHLIDKHKTVWLVILGSY